MSYRVITPENETRRVRDSAIEARANGECAIYYNERVDRYMMVNFKEIVAEFSRFPVDKRPRGYEGGDEIKKRCIQAIEHNNQTRMIDGKPVYTLVLQQADSSICPLGWGFDDAGFLVSGWIYCFFNEKIRDGLFNRFFVLPDPKKPKQKTKKVGVCITCKSVARLRCGGCKRACYCSAECQRGDWLHHKEICEGCN
jgi:hypothetical protein